MEENMYLRALHGMEKIIPESDKPMDGFTKSAYPANFQTYYESQIPLYDALEVGYKNAIDKDQYIENMAKAPVDHASSVLDSISQKRKKDAKLIDLNLCMVVYVLPAILKYEGECSKPLTDEILHLWKERFPSTNISAAPYKDIEAGFHKKWCYITTAVCETFGKPDDCYELNTLRNYRDSYLMNQPDGDEIVREYYDVAPTIVKRINRSEKKRDIYKEIWDAYLKPCLSFIENGENEACRELYVRMVRELQERFFYNN